MLENLEGCLRTISDQIKKYKTTIRKSQTVQFQTELKIRIKIKTQFQTELKNIKLQ